MIHLECYRNSALYKWKKKKGGTKRKMVLAPKEFGKRKRIKEIKPLKNKRKENSRCLKKYLDHEIGRGTN